jgi:hypothetical protein
VKDEMESEVHDVPRALLELHGILLVFLRGAFEVPRYPSSSGHCLQQEIQQPGISLVVQQLQIAQRAMTSKNLNFP